MLALVAIALLGQTTEPAARWQPNLAASSGSPVLTVAVPSSAPTVTSLCGAVDAGDKSGSWFCLEGDGGTVTGSSLAFAPMNSPTIQAWPVCPNGPNCASVDRMVFDAGVGQYMESVADFASPPGSFSVLAIASTDTVDVFDEVVAAYYQATNVWRIAHFAGAASWRFIVQSASGGSNTTGGLPVTRVYEDIFLCATYDVTDGIPRIRSRGSSDTGPALATKTLNSAAQRVMVGAETSTTRKMNGKIRGVFYTEKFLSNDDCDRIEALVLPRSAQITGTRGEALTITKSSPQTCCQNYAAGNCYVVPTVSANGACISGAGFFHVERTSINRILRSSQLDNAAWTVVGAGVVTPEKYYGALGYFDMEQLLDDQAGSQEGVSQVFTSANQRRYVLSAWLRSDSATKATLKLVGTGNSAGDVTCAITGLTSTPTRYACISPAAYGAGITAVTASILVGDAVGDTGSIGAGEVQLEDDGAFWTTDTHPSSYMPTFAAGVTRNSHQITFANPAAITNTEGCASVSYFRKGWNVAAFVGGSPLAGDANTRPCYPSSATQLSSFDGTNTVNLGSLSGLNDAVTRCSGGWKASDTSLKLRHLTGTTSVTGTYDTSIVPATWRIGDTAAAVNSIDAWVGDIRLGKKQGDCR